MTETSGSADQATTHAKEEVRYCYEELHGRKLLEVGYGGYLTYSDLEILIQAVEEAAELRKLLALGWHPITTAPKDATWVIVCSIDKEGKYARYPTCTKWLENIEGDPKWMMFSEYMGSQLTHWQPLMSPPAVKTAGE